MARVLRKASVSDDNLCIPVAHNEVVFLQLYLWRLHRILYWRPLSWTCNHIKDGPLLRPHRRNQLDLWREVLIFPFLPSTGNWVIFIWICLCSLLNHHFRLLSYCSILWTDSLFCRLDFILITKRLSKRTSLFYRLRLLKSPLMSWVSWWCHLWLCIEIWCSNSVKRHFWKVGCSLVPSIWGDMRSPCQSVAIHRLHHRTRCTEAERHHLNIRFHISCFQSCTWMSYSCNSLHFSTHFNTMLTVPSSLVLVHSSKQMLLTLPVWWSFVLSIRCASTEILPVVSRIRIRSRTICSMYSTFVMLLNKDVDLLAGLKDSIMSHANNSQLACGLWHICTVWRVTTFYGWNGQLWPYRFMRMLSVVLPLMAPKYTSIFNDMS